MAPLRNADAYIEKNILLDISKGDESAFRLLYDHHRRKVYHLSMRLLRSETQAEDIVQEVFSKIWLNRVKLPTVDHFPSWLNSIVRNHIYNLLRKKANEESFIVESLRRGKDLETNSEFETDMQQLTEWLYEAIDQLPIQQKKVFQRAKLQGLKHKEIAEELKISPETVKKHMMQAMASVSGILKSKQTSHLLFYFLMVFLLARN